MLTQLDWNGKNIVTAATGFLQLPLLRRRTTAHAAATLSLNWSLTNSCRVQLQRGAPPLQTALRRAQLLRRVVQLFR